MSTDFLDNWSTETMLDAVSGFVRHSEQVDMAVAFASARGIQALKDVLEDLLNRGGRLRILLGMVLPFGVTANDLSALKELNELDGALKGNRIKVSKEPYHGKLYLFRTGQRVTAIIGSSNLSSGGLSSNVEFNIKDTGRVTQSRISACVSFFDSLWEAPNGIPFRAVDIRVRKDFSGLRLRSSRRKKEADQLPQVELEEVQDAIELTLRYDHLHWGGRRGRHPWEAYLSIGRVRDYFPPRGTIFHVLTDEPDFSFDAKCVGSSRAGDPRPIHLTSYPSNKLLGEWLHDRKHAQLGDKVRIQRISDLLYYFELVPT